MTYRILGKYENINGLIKGLAIYSGASIFGPMVALGAVGYFLDKEFGLGHRALLISLISAFLTTNVLLMRKAIDLNRQFDAWKKEKIEADKKNIPAVAEVLKVSER